MKQLVSRPFWPLFLIIPALAVAIIASWWLLLQWQQQQTALQIQQLNDSASLLSIEPLQQKQPAALQVTLQALQQRSALPIRAMAVFDQSQRVFASTSSAEHWLEQAAQSLDPTQAEFIDTGAQLISTPIWADRAVADRRLADRHHVSAPAVSSSHLGYFLLLLDEYPTPAMQVLSPVLLLFLILSVLIWLGIKKIKRWQFEQIEQFALQLQLGNVGAAISTPLLQPLADAWLQKLQHNRQNADELLHDVEIKMIQLDSQLQLSQQTTLELSAQQKLLLVQLDASSKQLSYWQQLTLTAERLSPAQLVRQMRLLALYTKLHEVDFIVQPDAVLLPDWLLQCYTDNLYDEDSCCPLLFDEDPQAYAYKVNLDPVLLAHLLGLLVAACRQLVTEPEIIFSYRLLEIPHKQLKVNIKFVGRSFPSRWHQVLAADVHKVVIDDIAAEVSRCILQRLDAKLQINSIDGVGTQLELLLPVSWQKTNGAKLYPSILLVDENERRLPLAKQSLTALGEQVHSCGSYSQLTQSLQRRLVDLLVLMLPDQPETLGISVAELNALPQRFVVQAVASPSVIEHWQALLTFPVKAMPLLIGQLAAPSTQLLAQQQLLVVDDNLTNLTYVRAVLALEGLRIDIAMTGVEAIKMATHNRYQLILMDIQLPDIPGTEVTKQIRQLRHHQQTVILAFTAHALSDEIASFRLAGMDDVLIKPLDTQKIAHILARIKALDQS